MCSRLHSEMGRKVGYGFHPISELFPLLDGDGFDALVNDIRRNGVIEPVWVHEGKILDGRNRYRACQKLGIDVPTREWSGGVAARLRGEREPSPAPSDRVAERGHCG